MPRTLALPLLRPMRLCRPRLAIQLASPHPPHSSPHVPPSSLSLLSLRTIRHGISLVGGRETEELILATPPPSPCERASIRNTSVPIAVTWTRRSVTHPPTRTAAARISCVAG